MNVDKLTVLNIIKLRGSLNWSYCRICNRVYYGDQYDKEHKIILKEVETGKKVRLHLPIIIPPGLTKKLTIPFESLGGLWKYARYWLQTCKNVYFIGYSFRDIDVNALISLALGENLKLEKIYIIDKQYNNSSLEFEKKCKFVIPKKWYGIIEKPYYNGFDAFCKENFEKAK